MFQLRQVCRRYVGIRHVLGNLQTVWTCSARIDVETRS